MILETQYCLKVSRGLVSFLSRLNWIQYMWSLILYVVCSMYVCSMCMYVVFCKIDHCIHIHWCIVMGLGHNDPWVESYMWPQQTWGQRSSRGQWPLVQVFGKRVSVSTYFDVFSNLILQWLQKYMWSRKQARHVVRELPCWDYRGPNILTNSRITSSQLVVFIPNLKILVICLVKAHIFWE